MIQMSRPVFILALNPMQGNTENRSILAWSYSREALVKFVNDEIVEPYSDEGPDTFNGGTKKYQKWHRKGGPLEWYNRADDPIYSGPDNSEGGIMSRETFDQIAQKAMNSYLSWLNNGKFIPG